MLDYFSTQGWIYILFSIILTIICLILNIYIQGPGVYLLVYVIYILVILLTGYNITCLTKGKCYIWSWIVSIMTLIPMILLIVFMIYFIIYQKK